MKTEHNISRHVGGRVRWAASVSLCFASLWLLLTQTASGAPVDPQTVAAVVKNWQRINPAPLGAPLGDKNKNIEAFRDPAGGILFYLVSLDPRGFVVVSADDRVEPVICFSGRKNYRPSGEDPLCLLLTHDLSARMKYLRSRSTGTSAVQARKKWLRLRQRSNPSPAPTASQALPLTMPSEVMVAPLIQSAWDQSTVDDLGLVACYNYYTPPYLPGTVSNDVCGCVATAMAQVMRCFEYPTAGVGKVRSGFSSLVNNVNTPTNAFLRGGDGNGGPYKWDLMPLVPDGATTPSQCQAIGALTYDAGIAAGMRYTPSSSAAYQLEEQSAMVNIFRYANAIGGLFNDSFDGRRRSHTPGHGEPQPGRRLASDLVNSFLHGRTCSGV